jgi:hypothetical protein
VINGRPMILLDGVPCYPMIHALTDVPSGRWSWEELPQHNIRNFVRHGIRIFQLDLSLEHVWPAEDRFDLTLARKQVAGVLEACPQARVIFRFHVRAPRWWLQRNPDEWVVYADRDYVEEQSYGLLRIIEHDNNPVRRVSMASRKWRHEITARFIQFLKAFSETPEGDALAGIQVANGVYGEWHNWGFFDNEPDVSEPMNRAFREWLQLKYGSEDALREAWNRPDATFDAARAPGMDKRETDGIFRDLRGGREVSDFYACMHETVADNIIHFARTVKETWPRPIITGTFYGYYFSTFGRQAAGGHLQLRKILTAPELDYLSGPQAYEPEAIEVGDPYRSRSLIASVRLHGKLWLDELDVEPKIPLLKDVDYERRVQESVADVRRNAAFTFTKGMGFWFYDFNISGVDLDGYLHLMSGSQGNWDHPVVMRQIRILQDLFRERALNQPYRSEADVLFVYDTDSFYHTASLRDSDPVTTALIDFNSLAAFRSGVVFDPIHLDDLPKVDLSPYRVVVFGNTFLLTDRERRFIREIVAANGRQLVWFHAPGYLNESTLESGPRQVEELTGFRLKELKLPSVPEITFADDDAPPFHYRLGSHPFHPILAVEDPEAEELGTFSASGETAIARKSGPDSTSWFVSLPSQSVEPLRTLLRRAGAHVYGEKDAFFYGGGGLLVLHTREGGTHRVRLRSGKDLQLDLPEGPATILIEPDSGKILLGDYSQESESLTVRYP